jgi:pSer/pThr/pTyr-binding forkhead associated (FHA) protein
MPLTLLLRSSDTSSHEGIPALTFDGGRVVIGRGAGCDVRLPDPSVSHRHATVRAMGSEYAVVDEKSTNGTFVGGVRLAPATPRPLKSGELVRVGRVWLEVRIDQTPATRDLAVATRDLALALVSQAMRALGQDAETKVHVVEGHDVGAVLELLDEGCVYVIGRDATCALPLADSDVSRAHVNLVRRGGMVLVRDLGSKNGTWLGEARLPAERDVPWRSPATLRIGTTTMALDEPAALALAELEAVDDEPMVPSEVPEAPTPSESRAAPQRPSIPPPSTLDDAAAILRAPRASIPPANGAGSWSTADLAVMLAALSILALSVAGLVWLLRM